MKRSLTPQTKGSMLRNVSISTAILAVIAMPQISTSPAQAQLLDQLKNATGAGSGASGGGGLGIPPVGQASPSNTAGVLQYCIRNNYVNGGSASSVKDSVLRKVTGSGKSTEDQGFQSGNNGILQTGNGQDFSLGGNGVKEQVTRKVCNLVLQHAKSLL